MLQQTSAFRKLYDDELTHSDILKDCRGQNAEVHGFKQSC